MMFHVTPTLLAVLAIFNIASTLADDSLYVKYTLVPALVTINTPKMVYGGSGCGGGNRKCSCTLDKNGSLIMEGRGTSGTSTGLTFSCFFSVDQSTCNISVDIPYWGPNKIRCACPGKKIFGCDITGGSSFTKDMAVMPNFNQLDDPELYDPERDVLELDLPELDVPELM